MSFSTLGILPALAQAMDKTGIASPLPIQAQAAPILLSGKPAMLVSRTGSGKTLAYLLPILSRIDPAVSGVQAVVLAPTHELAMQIYRVATEVIREAGLSIRTQALIGGAASARQIEGLKKKPQLVVGSSGRLVHLMDLGKLKLRDTSWVVFDEADRLLIEEGMEHIRQITSNVGPETCYVFVSATEGPASTRFAKSLAPDLEMVRVREERISPSIRHLYLVCEERDKIEWLRKAVRGLEPSRALVFVHRGASASRMAERLDYHQLAVADLHGAHDKFARQAALEAFRKGQAKVLIASDIAARGLDVAGVELVINVDVPSQSRDYLHRAGRTGRAGAPGIVLSLMTVTESRLAKRYAEELDITMEPVRLVRGALVPSGDERAQDLRPAPRPFGPGRKSRTGGHDGAQADAKETTPNPRDESARPGTKPARRSKGAPTHGGSGRPAPSTPRSGPQSSPTRGGERGSSGRASDGGQPKTPPAKPSRPSGAPRPARKGPKNRQNKGGSGTRSS